jgi:hypothetical protein
MNKVVEGVGDGRGRRRGRPLDGGVPGGQGDGTVLKQLY